jgi:hypothetical protein
MKALVAAIIIGIISASGVAGASAAVGEVEQQTVGASPSGWVTPQAMWVWAQTFTAGMTGTLDQVDLYLAKYGDPPIGVSVAIAQVDDQGRPAAWIAGAGLAPEAVPAEATWVSVPLDPGVPVTASTTYAIVVGSGAYCQDPSNPLIDPWAPSMCMYYWGALGDDAYARGTDFTWWQANPVPNPGNE